MGTDDLFKKRKAQRLADLNRRKVRRSAYAKALIVCEGEKTEPYYFKGLKDHYELNSANIEICGDCDSDPVSIFRHAKQRYREEKDAGDGFDKVFCVFDRDTHSNYDSAKDAIGNARPIGVYEAITSVPCFEFWLLLHYVRTTKPYVGLPKNSAANQVITELRNFIPDYSKAARDIFPLLLKQLDFAIANANYTFQEARKSHTDNPSTRVHELVDFLRNIKNS